MDFAQFRNALCILKSIDRHELEAVGIIDVPKGQGVFPGCLDKPNAIWRLFRDDPYYWLLRADDDRAAKVWSIVETRLAKSHTLDEQLRKLPVLGVLNVDNPRDPRNKCALP